MAGYTHRQKSKFFHTKVEECCLTGLFWGQWSCSSMFTYIYLQYFIWLPWMWKWLEILQHLPLQNISSPSSTSSLDHPHPPSQKAHVSPCCRLKIKRLGKCRYKKHNRLCGTVAFCPGLHLWRNWLMINWWLVYNIYLIILVLQEPLYICRTFNTLQTMQKTARPSPLQWSWICWPWDQNG